jgi:uncharacterized protein (DUF3084 family)
MTHEKPNVNWPRLLIEMAGITLAVATTLAILAVTFGDLQWTPREVFNQHVESVSNRVQHVEAHSNDTEIHMPLSNKFDVFYTRREAERDRADDLQHRATVAEDVKDIQSDLKAIRTEQRQFYTQIIEKLNERSP